MDIMTIISLISGAVGGNIAGYAMSEKNLGPIVNTIAGLVGGGLGEFILKAFGVFTAVTTAAHGAPTGNEIDIAQLLGTIGATGVSGGVLTALISAVKSAMQK